MTFIQFIKHINADVEKRRYHILMLDEPETESIKLTIYGVYGTKLIVYAYYKDTIDFKKCEVFTPDMGLKELTEIKKYGELWESINNRREFKELGYRTVIRYYTPKPKIKEIEHETN